MGFYLLSKHKWPNGGQLVRWKGAESRVHRSFNTHKKICCRLKSSIKERLILDFYLGCHRKLLIKEPGYAVCRQTLKFKKVFTLPNCFSSQAFTRDFH